MVIKFSGEQSRINLGAEASYLVLDHFLQLDAYLEGNYDKFLDSILKADIHLANKRSI